MWIGKMIDLWCIVLADELNQNETTLHYTKE